MSVSRQKELAEALFHLIKNKYLCFHPLIINKVYGLSFMLNEILFITEFQ